MTMAEEMDPMGTHSNDQASDFQVNNNNPLITNHNIPWKQRKRKRLSAVLDKLHNNNNSSHNNNNNNNNNLNDQLGESSSKVKCSPPSSGDYALGAESFKSSGDDDDDMRSNAESPVVKREQFSSPLHFAMNDENVFNEQIKQEDRASDYSEGNRSENLSPMERYFPQMPSPLFEYYLQTKYLPEIIRIRNNLYPDSQPNSNQAKLPLLQNQQQQPLDLNQTQALQQQATPLVETKTQRQAPRKRQRQPKQSYKVVHEKPPPQDVPLDLSMKTISEALTKASIQTASTGQWPAQGQDISSHIPNFATILANSAQMNNFAHPQISSASNIGQVPIVKGDVASPTTKESVAFRYNLDVSPVVEEMPPGTDVAYVCPICGQMFSLHDRLAKHMASRHKSKSGSSEITKSYVCEVCDRSFARSDMLTRHMRLHTGIKPYTCKVCSQVFSRSDHLSTHQRTHTGEKPYKCPQCPYAACRRDMITRHMRTHARYEAQRAAAAAVAAGNGQPISDLHTTSQNLKIQPTLSPSNAGDVSKVTIKIEESSHNSSPKLSPYDEHANFLLNHPHLNHHHHLLNHQHDALVTSAAVAAPIIKTENTLLKIQ